MELTRILQIGAGRSTASMILALANISQLEKWQYTVIDPFFIFEKSSNKLLNMNNFPMMAYIIMSSTRIVERAVL